MVGVYCLHLFAGNATAGWLGTLLEKMPASEFWFMHAGLVAGAGLVLWLLGKALRPLLRAQAEAAGAGA